MKTKIYYFSGSGNSLWIAQNLQSRLENSELISIPKVINQTNHLNGDVIGIVCPIYFHNMPHIVADFITKIKSAKYIFMVYAGNGILGRGITATKKLFQSQNIKLSSLFNIPMPDNSTRYGETSVEKQEQMFCNALEKTKDLVKIVKEQKSYFDSSNTNFIQAHLHPGILFKFIHGSMNKMDKDFSVDESCTGCGTCQKVCPVNNIRMENKKPVWNQNDKCQVCCACHDWCPKEAIQHTATTSGVKRYHNPSIGINEIINSSMKA